MLYGEKNVPETFWNNLILQQRKAKKSQDPPAPFDVQNMEKQRLNNLLQSHTETGVQSEIESRPLKLQSSVLITKFFFFLD